MTAARIRDAVLLTGRELHDTAAAVHTARLVYRREGRPAHPAWEHLAELLDMAAWPPPDKPETPAHEPELMTTTAAADLLGVSPRTARRLAPQLDGVRIGGRWHVNANAVREHLAGRTHERTTP